MKMTKKIKGLYPVCLTLMLSTAALASEAGGGHEGGGDESLFAGTVAQSIAAIVVFLFLFALLYKKAWGPILVGLQDREQKIAGDLKAAQDSAKQAQAALDEYNQKLAEGNEQVRLLIEIGRADAQKLANQIKEQAQQELDQQKQRAQSDISAAKEAALNDIYAQAATLATDVAGRILKREINRDDQQQLVSDAISELGQASRN